MRVINGAVVWKHKATHGFPLDMALVILAENKSIPAWDYLFEAARRDGANVDKLTREVCFYVKEAYEKEYAQAVVDRLATGRQFGGIYGDSKANLFP